MISEIKTFLIAMAPIGEARVSIPIAINIYQLPIWSAYFFSVLGTLIPPFFILAGLGIISKYLSKKFRSFEKFFNWLFEKTRNRHNREIEKWKGVAVFVLAALPLPILGGTWTAALVAFAFGFSFKSTFPLVAIGSVISGIFITLLTLGFNLIL